VFVILGMKTIPTHRRILEIVRISTRLGQRDLSTDLAPTTTELPGVVVEDGVVVVADWVPARARADAVLVEFPKPLGLRVDVAGVTVLTDNTLMAIDADTQLVCLVVEVHVVTGVTDPMPRAALTPHRVAVPTEPEALGLFPCHL
jgi:hypothetical protein